MSEPFLAEIRPFAFNFAPKGWAMCNGQLLPINQNQALFSLLGTTYGGNGLTTFALPDLRGRSPMHFAPTLPLGTKLGTESTTLTSSQMPAHNHAFRCSPAEPDSPTPGGALVAAPTGHSIYGSPASNQNNSIMAPAGGSQPFTNLQPFQVINYCIAIVGVFPSRD